MKEWGKKSAQPLAQRRGNDYNRKGGAVAHVSPEEREERQMRIDRTVRRETGFVAAVTGICSVLMHAGFLLARQWSADVLWASLLSGAAAVANFFLMGLTVQHALDRDEKGASDLSRLSWTLRMLGLAAAVGIGIGFFHWLAAVLPIFFPRIAVAVRPLLDKRKGEDA